MINKKTVQKIVEDHIDATEYFLVETTIDTNNLIRVFIDSMKESVSIDFCVELNKKIESELDREIEDYELEVSSAGLTEPFKVPLQFEKNIGKEVEIFTMESKKLVGVLSAYNGESVKIKFEVKEKPEGAKRKILIKKEVELPLDTVRTIKQNIKFK